MMRNIGVIAAVCIALFGAASCERKVSATDKDTGPMPAKVVPGFDPNNFNVERPERFSLSTAVEYVAAPELNVTGVVSPDVSRQVPVPSLATGRVVEINAKLGDPVHKGQLLFKVRSSDIAGAYSDYQKAIKNEELARVQFNRAKILLDDGAIPKSQLEIAQTAEDNALVDLRTTKERLQLLGVDPEHPSGVVEVFAPVSGVITDQQITTQSGVQALTPPNPFTISDISHVWVVCDVYENNMSQVHIGELADIHVAAYPDRVLKARIANIMPMLDPNLRTAKVRLEVENQELLRLGMFVTATFHGVRPEKHAAVPATAVLHLHDRQWVYMPVENKQFRRVEVAAGGILPDNMQEIVSGVRPGDRVVTSALIFQNTLEH